MVICPNCKKETPEGKFCEHCGGVLQTAQTFQQPPQGATQAQKKNPILALILSIICGVGQMYNGQILKGVIMLVGCIILASTPIGLIAWILWLYGLYDAYTTAVKINNGEVVETFTTRA